jgi:hypothetical protein
VEGIEPVNGFQQSTISKLQEVGPFETVGRPAANLAHGNASCEALVAFKQPFTATRIVFEPEAPPQGRLDLELPLDQPQPD